MESVIGVFNQIKGYRHKRDDDFCDRLSSRYTVLILLVFAAIIFLFLYSGSPIICWAPLDFTENHVKYANSYCWVRNTYYVPFTDDLIPQHRGVTHQQVKYYQWIHFILIGQALLFYLPSVVWHAFNSRGGIDSDNILEAANLMTKIEREEVREQTLSLVCNQIDRFLGTRVEEKKGLKRWLQVFSKRFGSYLIVLFLISKLLYIGNVCIQFYILSKVLSIQYLRYGFAVMQDMAGDHDWHLTPYTAFPRVSMCDFQIRRLGNVHRYTLQCALPINLWIEKMYIFLWFWMVLVLVLSVTSFIVWLIRALFRRYRVRFVTQHLQTMGIKPGTDCDGFVDRYLRQDGAFVLRLIAHNTNSITTADIICQLWDRWREKPPEKTKFVFIQPTSESASDRDTKVN